MTEVMNPIPPPVEAPLELTASDRCDRCSAQAKVKVTMESGNDLLFCGHHGNRFEATLIAQGARIERGPLEYSGTPGAST